MKILFRSVLNKAVDIFYNDEKYLKIFFSKGIQNFGDVVTPILIEKLSGKKIRYIGKPKYFKNTNLLAIGSILHLASKDSIVWGSGFMDPEKKCYEKPKKVFAVRGPKTRELLLSQGVQCPEVYGDPALLLPLIYAPKIIKKYELGIIPHYTDKNNVWLVQFNNLENIKIIDVQNKNTLHFIDDILSCEKIASSSLHGIITADAYGIPSTWIEFSDKVHGFKFMDYFLSVKRTDTKPLKVTEGTTLDAINSTFYDYKTDIDLNKLLDSAPFSLKYKYSKV
ncbi:polysaccharide pyruvyl transferase family protein [bacterium]|nr:polysaccharide pyruvyl transferase family protein [bacterium]